jgi:Domain of unknown function (DUF4279)
VASDRIDSEEDRGEGRVRAAAYLTLLSAEIPPDELARRVGMTPDESWRKGDPRGVGRRRTHPFNGINYESRLDERQSPSDHLRGLIDRLRPVTAQIAAMAADPGVHSTRVAVVEHTVRDNPAIGADPETLRAIAEMGAELYVDVYFYGDNGDN